MPFPFTRNRRSPAQPSFDPAGMRVAIIGGSLGGLATANAFCKLGAKVTVFEKSPAGFEQRGACLGFVDVDLWEQLRGARLLQPNGQQAKMPFDGEHSFERQGSFYYGDMWKYLYSGLPEGCVKFGKTVDTLGTDADRPTIDGEVYDLAIVADGGWSTLRGQYIKTDRQPEYTGYQIYWARVDEAEVPDLTSFDGRTELSGIYASVNLPVPHHDGRKTYMCALFVATPEDEIRQPQRGDNRHVSQTSAPSEVPNWFLPFVRYHFAQHADGEIVRFFEAAARKGKITPSPVFEFGTQQNVAGRIVIIGDAAHMPSPMTALGAHTAMEDALGLWQSFTSGASDIGHALQAYDRAAIRRTKALLRRSQAVSKMLVPRQGKHAVRSPASLVPPQWAAPKGRRVPSPERLTQGRPPMWPAAEDAPARSPRIAMLLDDARRMEEEVPL